MLIGVCDEWPDNVMINVHFEGRTGTEKRNKNKNMNSSQVGHESRKFGYVQRCYKTIIC